MIQKTRNFLAVTLIGLAMLVPMIEPVIGLSEGLARKCHQLTLAAYPRPKNYTVYQAGDSKTARLRQAFYQDCIAKGGELKGDDVKN